MDFVTKEGFMLPAEWSPTAVVWLSWPVAPVLWSDIPRRRVEEEFVRLIRLIARYSEVKVAVATAERDRVSLLLAEFSSVTLVNMETDDVWCRDHGPTFLKNLRTGELAAVDWVYNGWGAKFPFQKDAQVAAQIAFQEGAKVLSSTLVCEGGAFDCNGVGRLLTTESVLLNPNRNPDCSQEEVTAELKKVLGVNEVIWLRAGLEQDDTDGHIDMVARFVGENCVLAVQGDTEILVENWTRLEAAGLEVTALPSVGEVAPGVEGSYANFLIVNQGVIVPQYGIADDEEAIRVIQQAFPSHQIEGFDCRLIGREGGGVHCLTQGRWA